ncbi:MAG: hypothetical protein IJQ16_07320 [Selenomonadaceae bacterium]|nr:hypothetical protein [Selenomonadaceae bacterium]
MTKPYFITYDLHAPNQNYEGIRDAIFRAADNGCISFWQSSYLISSSCESANKVMEFLQEEIDADDKVIIFEVTANFNFATNLSKADDKKIFDLMFDGQALYAH